jgi:serine kinase of HPr protein (carbohydrate metabolism regulator)
MLHATCVAIDGVGVLIRGPSGSGKSDLALRLIEGGATLVADDQVVVEAVGDVLRASAPPELRGRLEVRGLGIVACEGPDAVPVALIVDLVPPEAVDRLPDPAVEAVEGVELARVALAAFEASAAAKVRLAVRLASGNSMAPS